MHSLTPAYVDKKDFRLHCIPADRSADRLTLSSGEKGQHSDISRRNELLALTIIGAHRMEIRKAQKNGEPEQ